MIRLLIFLFIFCSLIIKAESQNLDKVDWKIFNEPSDEFIKDTLTDNELKTFTFKYTANEHSLYEMRQLYFHLLYTLDDWFEILHSKNIKDTTNTDTTITVKLDENNFVNELIKEKEHKEKYIEYLGSHFIAFITLKPNVEKNNSYIGNFEVSFMFLK